METTTTPADKKKNLRLQILVGSALLATLILMFRMLFVIHDILLVVGAQVVSRTIESEAQQREALSTLSDVWVYGGGVLWLIFIIASIEYFFKRLTERKTHWFIFWALIIQLGILLIWWVMG